MRLHALPVTKLSSVSRARAALSRKAATSSSFTRASAAKFASDFDHHAPGIARLNHGSFGATPAPVLTAVETCRARWLAQPDDEYFSGALDADLQEATAAAADAIGAPAAETALVENATVAAAIVFRRWSQQLEGTVLLPANAYGGVKASALAAFGPRRVKEWPFPFPGTTHEHILDWLDQALKQHDPRYVMLDHVSSQPAVVCPVAEMVALCRRRGVAEVAVDGAHALGQVAIDVDAIGADYCFSNLHKWAFAAPTATVLHSLRELQHVVPSWGAGDFATESRWTGTRDYAAMRAVPAALAYLQDWRSADGLTAPEFNRVGLRRAVDDLQTAWGVDEAYHEECLGSMGMVRLPAGLDLSADMPGQPVGPDSVRSRLRDRYGVEAAVGGFPEGGFLRLSHAVYTSDDDIERLRDAVLELV